MKSKFFKKYISLCGATLFLGIFILIIGCKNIEPAPVIEGDLTDIPYNPTNYVIKKPSFYPEVPIPADNPMTVQGIELGRMLFFDPILSGDSTQSCSTCHEPAKSFTDGKAVSIGIDGLFGKRSAMSLYNVAYVTSANYFTGLFWDGRSPSLEDQALRPVEDPVEMHNTWTNVVSRLKNHKTYPEKFRKAFGISNKANITKELAAKAIAQFERTLIGSGKSKYDIYENVDKNVFDDDEVDGKIIYFDEAGVFGVNLPDGQCFHCHGGITLTGNQFFNNGLENVDSLDYFPDKGLGKFNGNRKDNGKFRTPTLRNIALTAPYMHDGRFKTLEEVLNHYGVHGKTSPNEDPFINQIGFKILGSNPIKYDTLSMENRAKIVKFLHTLTDTVFTKNPEFQNPFF